MKNIRTSLHRRTLGMTLLEILVVIGLMVLLLGLGVGTYISMSKGYKEEGVLSQIDVMIRQVRNSAVTAQSPAYLEIDTANLKITPWATRTVAMWHFEELDEFNHTPGARHGAALRGASQQRNGKIGKCAKLSPGNFIDAGNDPDFDLDDGGYIEAFIKPLSGDFTGENFIFSKEGSFSLKIGKKGVLVGEIASDGAAKSVKVFSRSYKVVPGRWTKVAFAWDRNVTRVMADDVVLATGMGATPPQTSNAFLVGHDSQSFDGLVDEVRVLSNVGGGTLEMPPGYKLAHTAGAWNAIYFGGDGALDPRFHAGPVQISIEHEDRVRAVDVSIFGTTVRSGIEKKSHEVGEEYEMNAKKKAVQK